MLRTNHFCKGNRYIHPSIFRVQLSLIFRVKNETTRFLQLLNWMRKRHLLGNSAGDLFGMVKTWPFKGLLVTSNWGIKRSRLESPLVQLISPPRSCPCQCMELFPPVPPLKPVDVFWVKKRPFKKKKACASFSIGSTTVNSCKFINSQRLRIFLTNPSQHRVLRMFCSPGTSYDPCRHNIGGWQYKCSEA